MLLEMIMQRKRLDPMLLYEMIIWVGVLLYSLEV